MDVKREIRRGEREVGRGREGEKSRQEKKGGLGVKEKEGKNKTGGG